MRYPVIGMAAMLLTGPAFAQDPLILLAPQPFYEDVRPGANISGSVMIGALRHGSDPSEGSARPFLVDVPKAWRGEPLCVSVVTADGLYEALNAYPAMPPDWDGGSMVELDFPTGEGALLDAQAPGDLGIRVTRGHCGAPGAPAAVASWRTRGADGAGVLLLVKGFGADEVFAASEAFQAPVRCREIAPGGVTLADHVCALPAGVRGQAEITLHAVTDGIPAAPHAFELWLGAP